MLLTFASDEAKEEAKRRQIAEQGIDDARRAKKIDEAIRKGRADQTDGGRSLAQQIVPSIVDWLQRDMDRKAKTGNIGFAMSEIQRIMAWVDLYTMAHEAITVAIGMVGHGRAYKAKLTKVKKTIGERLEAQALASYVELTDPRFHQNLEKCYYNVNTRTFQNKLSGVTHALNKSEYNWNYMSTEAHVKVGAYLLHAINSIIINPETMEPLFKIAQPAFGDQSYKKNEKVHSPPNYLVYTESGLGLADQLRDIHDKSWRKPRPMPCFPLDWSFDEDGKLVRGGHVLRMPGKYGELIRNNNKTVKSQATPFYLPAINIASKVILAIDGAPLDIGLEAIKTTTEIGSLLSVERDSWEDKYMPIRPPELDDSDPDPELLHTYKRQKAAAHTQWKVDEQKAESPRRLLLLVNEYRDEPFCVPVKPDYRGRIYPVGDLHYQTADYVRATIKSAQGFPVTDQTKVDLLRSIANTGAFDGIDKESYEAREKWALEYVNSEKVKAFLERPHTWTSWHDADKPFCHWAACNQYHKIFIDRTKNYSDTFCYADATCSGLQIISGMQRFEEGCLHTNVLHTSKPGDAYKVTAQGAIDRLNDPEFMKLQYIYREEQRVAMNKKRPADKQIPPRGTDFEFDASKLNRSTVKAALMTYLYSATYQTISKSIFTSLKEKQGIDVDPGDRGIIVRTVLDTIKTEFKAAEDVNRFVQEVVKLTLASGKDHVRWISPAGLECVSIAQQPLYKDVRTHFAGGNRYAKLEHDESGRATLISGWGDVLPQKILSATPANLIHSADAATILGGYEALEAHEPVVTVHDSIGFVAGRSNHVLPHFRRSFYNVITSNILEGLIEENGLEGQIEPPQRGNAAVEECLTSEYLFC